ncbi:glycosyltransferase [Nostoc sp. FACHB-973]|nr:glycosyltransferase [Nostoc sp. FACHB-973]
MKIVYVITSLSMGGAENMLYKLLSRLDRERFSSVVVCLTDIGIWGDRIANLGIPVYSIGIKIGKPNPANILQVLDTVRQFNPDLIQGWMYHGNLVAQFAGVFLSKEISVLWNIRHSLYSLRLEKLTTAVVIKLCALLSNFPTTIVYNSKISATQHEQSGYYSQKTCVIPNGFDTEKFTPSVEAKYSVRSELGIPENALLIGLIARYHPMKDHVNFLQAASLLLKDYPDIQFILAGTQVDWQNNILCKLIYKLGLVKQIHLLGERQDMPRLTAALDIAASSSYNGEGFPNVIGEAMSCGVPCVVTDVGDSGWIVGNTGRVVPRQKPEALANAWKELIVLGSDGRQALGTVARKRIIECFSLESIVAQYEALYESVLIGKTQFKG